MILNNIQAILFTLIIYIAGDKLSKIIKTSILNKFVISVFLGIFIIWAFGISPDNYESTTKMITFFLPIIVVVLAVPIFKHWQTIKENIALFFVACLFSIFTNILLCVFIMNYFTIDYETRISILVKSVTSPMGLAITENLSGNIYATMLMTNFAGMSAGVFGTVIVRMLKKIEPSSKAIALGCNSHVIGSLVALEEYGEEAAAFATVSLIITGLLNVIIIPIVLSFMQ